MKVAIIKVAAVEQDVKKHESYRAVRDWDRQAGYWTNACRTCAMKDQCTTSTERRITRWEHEHVVEAAQRRLDEQPQKVRERRETVEHPFATIKDRMGATHFLTKTLPKVATEITLSSRAMAVVTTFGRLPSC